MALVDVELLGGLMIVLLGAVLGVSGATALISVWFPSWRRSLRVFVATISVPILIVGPILLFSIIDGDLVSDDLLMGTVVSILFCVLGWPVAHFLTRALDRQRSEKWETFE